MCGVIGYIGQGTDPLFFFNGLKRLEYRGYDSAGIAMLTKDGVFIERAQGKLCCLEEKLKNLPATAKIGIGHTRWATHGKPTENNAHPHRSGNIVLLHNGIIENYHDLKEMLIAKGYKFLSETDTEVAAHLLNLEYGRAPIHLSPFERMKFSIGKLVTQISGAFAFAILCTDTPDVLYAVKLGSPLVLGEAENENYLASGITALVEHTRRVLVMEDYEIAYLRHNSIELTNFRGEPIQRESMKVEWSVSMMEKSGYRHFMLKEIHEHPQAVSQTIGGRIERDSGTISLSDCGFEKLDLASVERIQIIACGTSYYAGLVGKYFIERFSHIPVELDLASEYRYQTNTANSRTLTIAVSQSGETADTLQAIKFARTKGARTLAFVNVPGSSIGQACQAESLMHAGPEIGVASTKAFTAQMTSLLLLALACGQEKKVVNPKEIQAAIEDFVKIPSFMEKCLSLSKPVEALSQKYQNESNMLFIGRGPHWAIALEGALKLKELSYIHAEAYAGGELKHGPIALIDENMPVVCLAPKDEYYDKTLSNIEEIRARGGRILSIGFEGDERLAKLSDDFIGIPECHSLIAPFLSIVPLHLFAYWVAVRKGTDVDQPRNLAKSVTVE